jgi:hypothetical protein
VARRGWTLLTLVAALLVAAAPAWADPPGPTHYDSTPTGLQTPDGEPADVDLEVEVLGGDSYLVVRAPAGDVIEVPGYEGEPYVRIEGDGTVLVNQRSPARWLNDERYGEADTDVPASADAEAPPTWEEVADGGAFAWHDHRIHFMSPTLPSQVDPSAGTPQPVADWEVPLTVDGEPIVVAGELVWQPGPSPLVPIGAVVLALTLVGGLVAWRRSALVGVVLVGVVATAGVGVVKTLDLPAGADGEPAWFVLPGMAAAALVLGHLLHRRGDVRGTWLRDAAGLPIGVWAVLQIGALSRPIVPGPLPVGLGRSLTAFALAAGIVALVSLVTRLIAATRLDVGSPVEDTQPA